MRAFFFGGGSLKSSHLLTFQSGLSREGHQPEATRRWGTGALCADSRQVALGAERGWGDCAQLCRWKPQHAHTPPSYLPLPRRHSHVPLGPAPGRMHAHTAPHHPAGPSRARSVTLVRTCSGFQCGRSSWMRRRAPGRMWSWSTEMPKHGTEAARWGPRSSAQPAPTAASSSMPHGQLGLGSCPRR